MTAASYIAEKLQEILGTQYEVMAHHAFEIGYTKKVQSPYGMVLDFNSEAFDLYRDKIIAVVETHYTALPNVSYTLINDTYTVHFWTPINYDTSENYALKGEGGEIAQEPPKFTFDDDMARLAAVLKNNKFEFTAPIPQADGTVKDIPLCAMITVSEPALEANHVEKSGAFRRVVFKVSGNILITDKNLETGQDIGLSVFNLGKFNPIKDMVDISFGAGTDANGIQSTDKDMTEQDVAASNWQISFKVFGFKTETDPALMIFNKKALLNPQILTPSAPNMRLKKLIRIKVEKSGGMRDVWGVLTVTISATGNTGIVRYDVNIVDSGLNENSGSDTGGDGIGGDSVGDGDEDGDYQGGGDEPDEPDEPESGMVTFPYTGDPFEITGLQMQVATLGYYDYFLPVTQKLDYITIPIADTPLENANIASITNVSMRGFLWDDSPQIIYATEFFIEGGILYLVFPLVPRYDHEEEWLRFHNQTSGGVYHHRSDVTVEYEINL